MSDTADNDNDNEALPNGQLLLLPMPEPHEGRELLEPSEEQRDRYPLSTVERNQERLQSVIHMLAADAPLRYICRTQRIGWHTLESIRAKQGTKIAAVKQVIARRMSTFVQLGVETLLDKLADGQLDPDKLGVTLGIISDKLQVLTGEATSIIGTAAPTGPRLTADTLRERLTRARVVDAEVTDLLPTGSEGEKSGQTRAGGSGAGLEADGADSQSGANIHN